VIPGGGGVGGEAEDIGQIDARIALRTVNVGGEVEDLREQDNAVDVEGMTVLEDVDEDGGTGGSVALTEDELGEFQRLYLVMKRAMKRRRRCVFVDAPEGLFRVFADEAAEAGAACR